MWRIEAPPTRLMEGGIHGADAMRVSLDWARQIAMHDDDRRHGANGDPTRIWWREHCRIQ